MTEKITLPKNLNSSKIQANFRGKILDLNVQLWKTYFIVVDI